MLKMNIKTKIINHYKNNKVIAKYPVSTAKNCLADTKKQVEVIILGD